MDANTPQTVPRRDGDGRRDGVPTNPSTGGGGERGVYQVVMNQYTLIGGRRVHCHNGLQ